jgi:arsenate reductase
VPRVFRCSHRSPFGRYRETRPESAGRSGHSSKTLEDLEHDPFDVVVTVCDHAHETCPVFPGNARVVHHAFDDPPKLAAAAIDKEEALGHYRRVRDEIKTYVIELPQALNSAGGTSE